MKLPRFGLVVSGLKPQGMPPPEQFRRLGERAEELGYDSVWVADRLASPYSGAPLLEGVATAAAFAGFTRRLPIKLGVLVAPARHPYLLAKQLATVDFLSGGRLEVGIGIGINAADYAAVGVPFNRRGRLVEELVPALRACWSDQPSAHHGSYYSFDQVWLEPGPARPGGPPIWIGGTSEVALERAARLGDGWLAYQVSAAQVAEMVDFLHRRLTAIGRDPAAFQVGILIPAHSLADGDLARREAQESFSRRWQREVPMVVIEEMCIVGSPEECRVKLAAFSRAGIQEFALSPQAWSLDPVTDAEELFAGVVAPARQAAV
ncbi:MAG TPA: TIGR03619 family F420-dependent LLM class oxidoreductase [Candidatus Dormibacteraeota bacterium]